MIKIIDKFGFFEAVKKKYEAKKMTAISTIKLYTEDPVGIGEHSEVQIEIEKWVEELASADEALSILNKYFNVGKR